jgi:hypothetical protein
MSIKINLLESPRFIYADKEMLHSAAKSVRLTKTEQNQQFKNVEIQNGYGTATKVSVSPGYGATVSVKINIIVDSISEETFTQIIAEVKNSSSYKNNSSFRKEIESSSYSSAASSSSGIFGWLLGKGSSSYTNNSSNLTESINSYDSGDASNNITVANSIADIMVKSVSKVNVTATVNVTGQLLVPSPTVIAVQSTVFSFTNEDGTSSSVTMLDQAPLIPVNTSNGTVSSNTVAPGSSLTLSPIGQAVLQE